jgi:hypothetical protein
MFWSSARETQETWLALATDHGKYRPLYVWQLWINVMTFLQCSLIIVLDVICSCSWHALLMPGITKTHNKPYRSNCREKTPQQNFEGEPQTMTKCGHIGNLTTVTPTKVSWNTHAHHEWQWAAAHQWVPTDFTSPMTVGVDFKYTTIRPNPREWNIIQNNCILSSCCIPEAQTRRIHHTGINPRTVYTKWSITIVNQINSAA